MTIKLELFDEELQRLWTEEALRRDGELDTQVASSRDVEDVFRDARALITSQFPDNDRGVTLREGEYMKQTFTATVWRENGWYIAQCREFEIASQGSSKDEALHNLAEAIEVHFEPPIATIVPEVITIEAEVAHGRT